MRKKNFILYVLFTIFLLISTLGLLIDNYFFLLSIIVGFLIIFIQNQILLNEVKNINLNKKEPFSIEQKKHHDTAENHPIIVSARERLKNNSNK